MAVIKDYTDADGVKHRVLVPNEDSIVEEGVPVSLDIRQLYSHMPPGFVAKLTEALWSRGLIEPADYFKPGAHELTRDAILDMVRFDALSIISLARSMREQE